MFSSAEQQIPYVLQAWTDRNGTSPADWKVIEIDSGQEVASARPSYASAAGIDPLWRVYLRTNMARSVEVRAPDEESALAAAKQADPYSFPNFITINDVAISRIDRTTSNQRSYDIIRGMDPNDIVTTFMANDDSAAIARLDQYSREHPGAEYNVQLHNDIQEVPLDIEVNYPQPTSGNDFTGWWKIVDSNGNELYRFNGVGNAQIDANRVARDWITRHPEHAHAGLNVVPIMA
jgi:hypothetical protein